MSEQSAPRFEPTHHKDIGYLPPPPSGFRAVDASDSDLVRFGYPPRPRKTDGPNAVNRWLQRVSTERIVPDLRAPKYRRTHEIKDITANNNIWAGAVISSASNVFAPSAGKLYNLDMSFTVPNVYRQAAPIGEQDHCVVWAGYDGYGGPDVFQAGVHMVKGNQSGGPHGFSYYETYPWIEWYPASELQVTNLPANPGDLMDFSLAFDVTAGNPVKGSVTIYNLSSYQNVCLGLAPQSGSHLIGNCVEWIIERPQLSESGRKYRPSLANFDLLYVNCSMNIGATQYDFQNLNGEALLLLTMVDMSTGTRTLCKPYIEPVDVNNKAERMYFQFLDAS